MTDTPRVPSEATTGTPPEPATLDCESAATAPITDGAEASLPPDTAPASAEVGAGVGTEVGADAGADSSGDASIDASDDPSGDTPADAPEDAPADAPTDAPTDASTGASAGAPAAPATEVAPPRIDLSPAACAASLAEHFPALFGGPPRPLKLRIQADIQARAPGVFTRKALSVFLHRHTTSNAYLNALVKAPQRVDLDGADAGEIAEEHKAAAIEELARRKAVHETRRREARAAENAARRASPLPAPDAAGGEADAASASAGATAPGTEAPRPDRPRSAQRPGAAAREGQARPAREPQRDSRSVSRNERPQAGRPGRPCGPDDPRPGAGSSGHAESRPEQRMDKRREASGRPAMGAERPAHAANTANPSHSAQTSTSAAAQPAQPAMNEAERERAALLRAYEGSTLTRANFCVLKRIEETALEAQLLLARQERALRPAPPARTEHRNDGRAENRAENRADFRPGPGQGAGPRPSRGGDADGPRGPRRPRPPPPGR